MTATTDTLRAILTSPVGGMLVAFDVDDLDTPVFSAPLARDFREDPDEPLLWIRPIVAYNRQLTDFDVQECRPRTLPADGVTDGNALVFVRDGERIEVRPADEDAAWVIDAWEDWLATQSDDAVANLRFLD